MRDARKQKVMVLASGLLLATVAFAEPYKDGYFQKFVPGYLEYWPKHVEIRAKLWADQQAVREIAKPVRRHYEVALSQARKEGAK